MKSVLHLRFSSKSLLLHLPVREDRQKKQTFFLKKHGNISWTQITPLGGDLFKNKIGAERVTALLLLRTKTQTNKQKKKKVGDNMSTTLCWTDTEFKGKLPEIKYYYL